MKVRVRLLNYNKKINSLKNNNSEHNEKDNLNKKIDLLESDNYQLNTDLIDLRGNSLINLKKIMMPKFKKQEF